NESVAAAASGAGKYVASEILQITSPVKSAGQVLDAGISAGANGSYGLTYQSSNADALYRQALAKAVQSAHDTAQAIAAAAHLSIVSIASISNTQEAAQGSGPGPMMARQMASAPILAGTDTMSATVYVIYRVK
ncbi:MAG TPA: SIMPL domain-containing protein, partial [Candidatus Eremiobacteraceae bacterium]|nr:SIMPL domain-containing protein [Candidatus Eremiobacteraceae bacterium]